jgi:hypothetical protein
MPVQDLYYKKYLKYKNKYLELKQYGGMQVISERALEDDEAEPKHQKDIKRHLEMDMFDGNKNKNKNKPLHLSNLVDDSIINFNNKHRVSWEAIEGGREGYQEFDNYMQAYEFVTDKFYRSYDDNKNIKWTIVDVETGAIINMYKW